MFIKFKVINTGATNGFPILHYCFIMSVMDTLQFQSLPSGSRKLEASFTLHQNLCCIFNLCIQPH